MERGGLTAAACLTALVAGGAAVGEELAARASVEFFEQKVLPLPADESPAVLRRRKRSA